MGGKFYAGIGSRATPLGVKRVLEPYVKALRLMGYTLRTGGAYGADQYFEECSLEPLRQAPKDVEPVVVYLPWEGYTTPSGKGLSYHRVVGERGLLQEEASCHHPAWVKCSEATRKLHARNVAILLGEDLKQHAQFVICWTGDGVECGEETTVNTGGTGHGIRVASFYGIPVYNVFRDESRERLRRLVTLLAEERS